MKTKSQKISGSFNVAASAGDEAGEIKLSVDFTAPTRGGWTAFSHADGVIKGINGVAADADLRKVEAAYAETAGNRKKEAFAAYAASFSGEEFRKKGFVAFSEETEALAYSMHNAHFKAFADFSDRVSDIFGTKTSASLNSKLVDVTKPSAPKAP